MSPHDATYREAIQAFALFTNWWGGWIPVRLGTWTEREVMWRHGPHSDLPELVSHLDARHDDEILLGLPQAKPFNGGVGVVSILWARVTGSDQVTRARQFKPHPSLVLQDGTGSGRLLLWALEETISWPEAVAANKRIAYRLRAVQKWADPDLLWVNAPGTFLRNGRARPAPVRVGRLSTATFTAKQVAGSLKDPPANNWWEAA